MINEERIAEIKKRCQRLWESSPALDRSDPGGHDLVDLLDDDIPWLIERLEKAQGEIADLLDEQENIISYYKEEARHGK